MAYSQFHDGFWTDPEIRKLSPEEKMVFIWFITNPSRHYSGVYFFEYENISKQTGLSKITAEKGIDTLSRLKFIKYNPDFSMVWVRKMARYEVRRSEKTGLFSHLAVKGIANHFQTLHNCPLIQDFMAYYPDLDIPYLYPIRQVEVEIEEEIKSKDISSPSKSKKIKKEKTPIPEDFGISESVKAWAQKHGFGQLDEHLAALKRKAAMNGYTYLNWDAAFMEAIREDWAKIRKGGRGAPLPTSQSSIGGKYDGIGTTHENPD